MYNVISNKCAKNCFKKLISLLSFVSLLLFSACNNTYITKIIGGSDDGKTVTAVDGYVKDAKVTDSSGQVATYSGEGGKYTFENIPTHPIKLTGGLLEETNEVFDIDMIAHSGLILSPITTFIEDDDNLRQKLTDQGFAHITSVKGFAVNYIDKNDPDLTKLAQLLYVMLRDKNVTSNFKVNLKNTVGIDNNISKLFIMAKKVMKESSNTDKVKKAGEELLDSVEKYQGPSSGMEHNIIVKKKGLMKA
jgi:hypothetical protein